MPKQTTKAPETRLSIRANPNQKSVLSRAATVRHMNVSQFVLDASLREAEQVISEENRIAVSEEEYDWLIRLMDEDAPAVEKPRLREAVNQKAVWDA